MRVLIIKTSALGDILHALPVLDYLHKTSPGIVIDWVVEDRFRELLEGNPLINRLHLVRTRAWRKQPLASQTRREVLGTLQSIREFEYDFVFDIQGNLKSGVICQLARSGTKIGFARGALQESINLLFTNRRIPLRRQDKYVSDNYLRLVSVPFGRDYTGMSLTTELPSSLADETCAQAFLATLADGLVFLFQIGTTWETKFWHEEGWIALGVGIHDLYPEATIVINWGNATEKGTGERLAAAVGGNIRLLPWMSIGELIALLKKVDLVVGGDTGPVHIAAAVGTPTVSFYRATDGQVLGPRGNDHVRIQAQMGCTACYRTRCDKDAECRRSVRVEAIQAGIKKLLGEGLEN